ncbi:PREDICTED: lipase 3-like [Nicrophorus vespilloides]|uniref:Lipase 3-like n=1 Tax=Nicrophorus vespilloides TaxID=110193 RepID=A0ABM1NDC2_NICVS|nr:PREDICTED: lipase 3-like [Nicrophorus vespilloides]
MFLSTIILSLIGANRIVADTTKEIVEKYGYPFEEYKDIQSPDGYLLTLHRILYGRTMLDKTNISKPVFLLHGIFSSSVSFVFAGPNISIAYQLADRGYDVWLGNCRGTSYSTKHSIHSIHSSAFWNFTIRNFTYSDVFFVPMFLSIVVLSLLAAHGILAVTTKDIVESYGYPFEEYRDIQTPDGYFLTLHRIPSERNILENVDTREAVLLMHGLFCSSINFVFAGPNISLAYQLADQGYDVWLGNSRSTSYSKKHASHDIDSLAFWNFTIDDLAMNDLRTTIDFVLDQTKNKQITYVGYSQGNTILAMLLSDLPEYNAKIKLYIALAPILSFYTFYHPWILPFINFIPIFNEFGMYEIPPMVKTINDVISFFCNSNCYIMETLCIFLIESTFGSEKYINKTAAEPLLENILEGIGLKILVHLKQIHYSGGKLRKFDYGINENIRIYGKALPPDYEINQILVPTAMYYANCDWLVSREDVAIAKKQLPNIIDDYLIPMEIFNHFDFLWAGNIKEVLLNRILKLIDSYNK